MRVLLPLQPASSAKSANASDDAITDDTEHGVAPYMSEPLAASRFVAKPQAAFQYTPTVVVAASSWNGRTPLTPSHGYFALGGSRSPSSRSANRGTKNSFVNVVNSTRPVWPYSTELVVILEIDHLRDRPRLRGIVSDLVAVGRPSACRPSPGP